MAEQASELETLLWSVRAEAERLEAELSHGPTPERRLAIARTLRAMFDGLRDAADDVYESPATCEHPLDQRSASVELGYAYCSACGAEVDHY